MNDSLFLEGYKRGLEASDTFHENVKKNVFLILDREKEVVNEYYGKAEAKGFDLAVKLAKKLIEEFSA